MIEILKTNGGHIELANSHIGKHHVEPVFSPHVDSFVPAKYVSMSEIPRPKIQCVEICDWEQIPDIKSSGHLRYLS